MDSDCYILIQLYNIQYIQYTIYIQHIYKRDKLKGRNIEKGHTNAKCYKAVNSFYNTNNNHNKTFYFCFCLVLILFLVILFWKTLTYIKQQVWEM